MKLLKKRCSRCGEVGPHRPRERRCKRMHRSKLGFKTGYWCYGNLVTVKEEPKVATPTVQKEPEPKLRPQERAARDLERVRKKIDDKRALLRRTLASLAKLEKKADRLSRKASMSDAEVEVRRQARIEARSRRDKSKARRAIKLSGSVSA